MTSQPSADKENSDNTKEDALIPFPESRRGEALCETRGSITIPSTSSVNNFLNKGPLPEPSSLRTETEVSGAGNSFRTQTSHKREGNKRKHRK